MALNTTLAAIKNQEKVSSDILESIVSVSAKDELVISNLMWFIQSKTMNFELAISMVRSDTEVSAVKLSESEQARIQANVVKRGIENISFSDIDALEKHQNYKDLETIMMIQSEFSRGNLVGVASLIHQIRDESTRELVKIDFKDLASYIDRCEKIVASNSPEIKQALSEEFSFLNENGNINIVEIKSFAQQMFEKSYMSILAKSEEVDAVQENTNQQKIEFDDAPANTEAPKM